MKSKLLIYLFSLALIISLISCSTPKVSKTTVEETTVTKDTETTTVEKDYEEVVCNRVIDGDTIEVKDDTGKTFKVRYIGIDTPEVGDNYFEEAKEANKSLVEGKTIKMYKDVSDTDKYSRLLRYVYVGTIFVNAYLVENGFAMASTYPPDVKNSEYFAKLQNEAQSEENGFWGIEIVEETTETTDAEKTDAETTDAETTDAETTDAETTDAETNDAETTDAETNDAETTDAETNNTETIVKEDTQQEYSGYFVGSKNSDVYHYPDCASAKRIKPENLVIFNSVEEAKAAGYRPCLKCNPPG